MGIRKRIANNFFLSLFFDFLGVVWFYITKVINFKRFYKLMFLVVLYRRWFLYGLVGFYFYCLWQDFFFVVINAYSAGLDSIYTINFIHLYKLPWLICGSLQSYLLYFVNTLGLNVMFKGGIAEYTPVYGFLPRGYDLIWTFRVYGWQLDSGFFVAKTYAFQIFDSRFINENALSIENFLNSIAKDVVDYFNTWLLYFDAKFNLFQVVGSVIFLFVAFIVKVFFTLFDPSCNFLLYSTKVDDFINPVIIGLNCLALPFLYLFNFFYKILYFVSLLFSPLSPLFQNIVPILIFLLKLTVDSIVNSFFYLIGTTFEILILFVLVSLLYRGLGNMLLSVITLVHACIHFKQANLLYYKRFRIVPKETSLLKKYKHYKRELFLYKQLLVKYIDYFKVYYGNALRIGMLFLFFYALLGGFIARLVSYGRNILELFPVSNGSIFRTLGTGPVTLPGYSPSTYDQQVAIYFHHLVPTFKRNGMKMVQRQGRHTWRLKPSVSICDDYTTMMHGRVFEKSLLIGDYRPSHSMAGTGLQLMHEEAMTKFIVHEQVGWIFRRKAKRQIYTSRNYQQAYDIYFGYKDFSDYANADGALRRRLNVPYFGRVSTSTWRGHRVRIQRLLNKSQDDGAFEALVSNSIIKPNSGFNPKGRFIVPKITDWGYNRLSVKETLLQLVNIRSVQDVITFFGSTYRWNDPRKDLSWKISDLYFGRPVKQAPGDFYNHFVLKSGGYNGMRKSDYFVDQKLGSIGLYSTVQQVILDIVLYLVIPSVLFFAFFGLLIAMGVKHMDLYRDHIRMFLFWCLCLFVLFYTTFFGAPDFYFMWFDMNWFLQIGNILELWGFVEVKEPIAGVQPNYARDSIAIPSPKVQDIMYYNHRAPRGLHYNYRKGWDLSNFDNHLEYKEGSVEKPKYERLFKRGPRINYTARMLALKAKIQRTHDLGMHGLPEDIRKKFR